jgi:serine/threonine-protein kinase
VGRDVALTPDTSHIIYVGADRTTLFVRALDQLAATPLVRGVTLRDPFVSPDGQWVGFFDQAELKKVAITGGPVMMLARLGGAARGGTWSVDGTIIYAANSPGTGLQRVSADGGTPAVLTRPDHARGEANHAWPEVLPGGQAVLYTIMSTSGLDASSIVVLDLQSGRSTVVLRGGSDAQFVPSGHLLYATAGSLRAVAFDLTRRVVVGPSTSLASQAPTSTVTGGADAAVARDGTLVYVSGAAGSARSRTLVWVDRQGHETLLGAPPHNYTQPRISPDGSRVAVVAADENVDIWLWDIARATLTRVTSDSAVDATPVWTLDGRQLIFNSNRTGTFNLFRQAADGTGAFERLTESPSTQVANALSPDGTRLVFTQTSPTTGPDLMALQLNGVHHVVPLVQTPFTELNGIVSPDGRWLAYEANDTGSFEVYVRPFPDVTRGRWPVSTSGGRQPLWALSGQELFYFAPDGALMRVAVASGLVWNPGAPTKLLDGRYDVDSGGLPIRNYDVAADGQRFLMIKLGGSDTSGAPPQLVVVQHFDEELKRLLPVKY